MEEAEIDTAGKVLEKIILHRTLRFTEGENGLSSNQYGFRKGRSTVDAILSVTKTAEKALEPKRRGISFCAVVTLDVRNAFNSASWSAIAHVLWGCRSTCTRFSKVTFRIVY